MNDRTPSQQSPAAFNDRDRALVQAELLPLLAMLRPNSWTEESTKVWLNSACHFLVGIRPDEVRSVIQEVGRKTVHLQKIVPAIVDAVHELRARNRRQREREHPMLASPENVGKERWPGDILALEWEGRPWRDGPKSQEATNAVNDALRHLDSDVRYDRSGKRFRCVNWGTPDTRPSNIEETWKPHPRPIPDLIAACKRMGLVSLGLRVGALYRDDTGTLQMMEE